jgi:hypothetical protein
MSERPHIPNWLRPLWVRIAVVVLPLAWSGFELWRGDPLWCLLFFAVGVWGAYTMLYDYKDPGNSA